MSFRSLVEVFSLFLSNKYRTESEILGLLKSNIHKIPINIPIQASGTTLLNQAIHHEYYEIVKLLIDNGADVSLKNNSQSYKPVINNLHKNNIPLTSLLLKHSKTQKEDLLAIINHCVKFKYSNMLIYAINALYLLKKKDINYILNIKTKTKLNAPPEIYKQIINYPALCLEFNASFYKYYPKETRERIMFIIWIMKMKNMVLPLELVFLILKKINLVIL